MKKRKRSFLAVLLAFGMILSGCGNKTIEKTDSYEYLIGVSLINVMEPWLNNFVRVLTEKTNDNQQVNMIFRDAAASTEKQLEDIEGLIEYGIDLLIVSTDGSLKLQESLSKINESIPVVAVGVDPGEGAYTTLIQTDDEGIGEMAGDYILDLLYEDGDQLVVLQGVESSPISDKRLKGFQKAIQDKIPEDDLYYYYGDWIRDQAELRMKDYLVVYGSADIVFAFNDEMAYGAYLASQQLRVQDKPHFVGVDGFEGEIAGLNLVEKGVLDATIQIPDFGTLAYDTALQILEGASTEKDIRMIPRIFTGD